MHDRFKIKDFGPDNYWGQKSRSAAQLKQIVQMNII